MAVGDLLTNEGDLEWQGRLFPSTASDFQKQDWKLIDRGPVNPNDTTIPFGTLPGFDGVGGVPGSATYMVTPDDDAGANIEYLCGLLAPTSITSGVGFMLGGQPRVRFGRPRGAFPAYSFRYPTELRWMFTDPTFYGLLTSHTATHGTNLVIDAGGSAPTRQWSISVGACVNPTIGWTGPDDLLHIITYPTVPSGHTLTVSGSDPDIGRATFTDGSGNVSIVQGFEAGPGRPATIGPVTANTRTFSFDRDSGANTATVTLRDGFY